MAIKGLLALLKQKVPVWNRWRKLNPTLKLDLSRVNLSNADLVKADLSDINLSRANLTAADLTSANLSRSNLTHSKLKDATLRLADLRNAHLINARLNKANFSGANLNRANFSGADLRGAFYQYERQRLMPVSAEYLTSLGATYDEKTRFGDFESIPSLATIKIEEIVKEFSQGGSSS
ncbi:MAG: pentapeptide repeat-containing protein [Acidobacteriota bacterium]